MTAPPPPPATQPRQVRDRVQSTTTLLFTVTTSLCKVALGL
jgi:hypothetical protein